MTEEKIREEFGVFGTITSCKIMQDEKNGDSKGFGFVCFSSPDESNKAIQEMNGRLINGKPLYVAMAQRKDDRQHYLASQIQQRNMRMQQSLMPGAPPVGYPGQPMFYPQQRPPFFQGQPPQMMGARPGQFPPNQPQMGVRPNFPVPPQGFHPQQTGGHQQRPQNRGGRQNNNVGRPQGMNQQPRGPMKYPNQQAARPQIPQLDLASLATLEPEQQKQVLGESLFPLVLKLAPENVGKLTGMLLVMDKGEVLHLLENPEALKARVSEGVAALEEAKAAMKSA